MIRPIQLSGKEKDHAARNAVAKRRGIVPGIARFHHLCWAQNFLDLNEIYGAEVEARKGSEPRARVFRSHPGAEQNSSYEKPAD